MNISEEMIEFTKRLTEGRDPIEVLNEAAKWCKENNCYPKSLKLAAERKLNRTQMEKLSRMVMVAYFLHLHEESLKTDHENPQNNG